MREELEVRLFALQFTFLLVVRDNVLAPPHSSTTSFAAERLNSLVDQETPVRDPTWTLQYSSVAKA
eukprot:scaffold1407_cov379-Pavlova_lutheri.AAC.7